MVVEGFVYVGLMLGVNAVLFLVDELRRSISRSCYSEDLGS